ncbi:MAG: arylesterase [Opitutae bacterium]|nr:arylesterase [Opitutae bacterium]
MLRRLLLLFFLPLLALPGAADERRTVVFFGDSLTAGYGVDLDEAFPALIQKRIDAAGLPWRVVNAGLSGETTAGGRRRIDWVLKQRVDCLVLELGGNDGLRGLAPKLTQANLQAIIDRVRAANPRVRLLLAGMMMPPNFGEEQTREFAAIYPALAEKNHLALIPFLLEGVGGRTELNKSDGIHPTAQGHAIVAGHVWKYLEPLLKP